MDIKSSRLRRVFSGVWPALSWRCWPRSLRGPSTKPWRPFSRSPRSPPSPRCPRACPTPAGTSCGRCSWRRSGGRRRTPCCATPSCRAASEVPAEPLPLLPLPLSSLARPAPWKPRLHHLRRRRRHRCSPGLSVTSTSCHAVYNQCLPCQEGCQVVPIRPAKRENQDCCPLNKSRKRDPNGRALCVSSLLGPNTPLLSRNQRPESSRTLRNCDCDRRSGDVSCRRKLGRYNIFIWQTVTHRNLTL